MTIEHRAEAEVRSQRVLVRPHRSLYPSDLPADWPAGSQGWGTVILGPLLPDDVDVAAFLDAVAERAPGAETAVLDAARPGVTICLSAEETARWAPGHWDALGRRARRVARTLGAAGAEIRTRTGFGPTAGARVRTVLALPAAVVDTTGAGDVFATALILAMRAGVGVDGAAGRLAAAYAAACVERCGAAPLPTRAALEARAGVRPGAQQDGARGDDS
ncbi:MAG: hypothetical protein EXR64_05205 [Dehalococcoidia bacterium]|nr:hypothetical protein [Dehalococcoidia bacterium]